MSPVGNSVFQPSSPIRAILVQSLCFVTILILTASPLYAVDQDQVSSIHNSIIALDSARETALQELESISSPSSEIADYKDFIVYLNTRIVSYCMELAEQSGPAALEGLPCPTDPTRSGTEVSLSPSGEEIFYTSGSGTADAQTQSEKTADLDGDFLTALGDFDEMLLKEEGKVAARVPSQRESGASGQSGTAGSGGASGEEGETGSGEEGEQGTGSEGDVADGGTEGQGDRSGSASGTQSSAGSGGSAIDHSVYGAPGGKLPPPEDDDIVARQLREAAEKEPDPELKKKLWEEYWKYKGVSK
ncbi:MAG: hypothetical protein JRC99_13580 [Deltaproteobacteria bacterium]|nr:hypothetical protein [Deltaproteobacteria bacterium]